MAGMTERRWDFGRPRWLHRRYGLWDGRPGRGAHPPVRATDPPPGGTRGSPRADSAPIGIHPGGILADLTTGFPPVPLDTPMNLSVLLALVVLASALLYFGRAYWGWVLPLALGLGWWWLRGGGVGFWLVAVPALVAVLVFGLPVLRRPLITRHVLRAMKPLFPDMSDTERTALEAGTVWWDAELFSGRPNWQKLRDFQPPGLSERERSFLANEVEEVCRLVDDEQVDELGDLSEEAWQYLKDKGFMGMIIPEQYGGLGFSAEANSAVVTKVASHNTTLAVTVMVPNSLGPAELLLHYGTKDQKDHYLPRLADGTDIPAFALTEPLAGSDAGAMTSSGVVCKGEWKGVESIGIRLDWDKRYITLAPVATLLGLAFKLHDPDHLLGEEQDLGITCALIPTYLPGVEVGERHDPLGVKFINGPTYGSDVFVPLDYIIGGKAMAGQGWRMLMDCLSAGRSLSLPALSCGGAQVATRAISAYALIREQFGLPLARFEGVEEHLSRIFGTTWTMDSARLVTAGAVASGQKPSVISAIVKAWLTEGLRDVINDAMDVQAGAGISRGPRNVLAGIYQGVPIGITVEGANILTRTMIVFGQGALRCHPYAFVEMEAARRDDLKAFDRYFFKHVGLLASNVTRAWLLALTGGALVRPPVQGAARRHYQRFSHLSAAFAAVADFAMGTLGGGLKRKEKLSGRLADALAWLYIGSTCLKRFELEGSRESDEPLLHWACAQSAWKVQEALDGTIANLPNRAAARALRVIVFPLGRRLRPPSDRQGARVVRAVLEDRELRERMTSGIYMPSESDPGLGALERGHGLLLDAAEARGKVVAAVREGTLPRRPAAELLDLAVEKGVIEDQERDRIRAALEAQRDLIQVDAFDPSAYLARCGS